MSGERRARGGPDWVHHSRCLLAVHGLPPAYSLPTTSPPETLSLAAGTACPNLDSPPTSALPAHLPPLDFLLTTSTPATSHPGTQGVVAGTASPPLSPSSCGTPGSLCWHLGSPARSHTNGYAGQGQEAECHKGHARKPVAVIRGGEGGRAGQGCESARHYCMAQLVML